MKSKRILSRVIVALLVLAGLTDTVHAGQPRTIALEDLPFPEDLVGLAGSRWVIVSNNAAKLPEMTTLPGPISAIDTDSNRAHEVTIRIGRPLPGTEGCNAQAEYQSHGLNAVRLGRNRYRLYVVNHLNRESIEIFDLSTATDMVRGTWRGCLLLPEGVYGNAIAPVSEDVLAMAGRKDVVVWERGAGWRKLARTISASGIETSADRKSLLVGDWAAQSILKVPLSGGPVTSVATGGNFHPDDLRRGDDGEVYAVSHEISGRDALTKCGYDPESCRIPFKITRITEAGGLRATDVVVMREPGRLPIIATAAARFRDRFWVGSVKQGVLVLPATD